MWIERSPIAAHEGTPVDVNADVSAGAPALVGPHAVIHAVAAMRERLGDREADAILANAQIGAIPTGEAMIPERDALRLHRWLAMREPIECFAIAEEAGARTADYIIANRIPAPAVWLLRLLPARLAAPLLMRAIRQHAWTFVGAGRFTPEGAWAFEIDRGAADDPVLVPDSLFHWYASVFQRLYRRLVAPRCRCRQDTTPDERRHQRRFRIDRR